VTLACPACGREHAEPERFCSRCGVPLVPAGHVGEEAVLSERGQRARKIKPQLAEGELVRVAGGRNLAEAEFIQNMLLEEGVPSTLRRTRGFDVPEMLAAGPRDVMVPVSGAEVAREVLLDADLAAAPGVAPVPAPWKVLSGVVGGVAIVAAIVFGVDVLAR
jgi:hypothetical protein